MSKQVEKKKIIIIGAGLSGLTAGVYGQNNGFLTEIFEKNPVPGGLCRNWVRKGLLKQAGTGSRLRFVTAESLKDFITAHN